MIPDYTQHLKVPSPGWEHTDPLDQELRGEWRADRNNNGNRLPDYASGNHGALTGGARRAIRSWLGPCVHFSTGDYVLTNASRMSWDNPTTIEYWIKSDGIAVGPGAANYGRIAVFLSDGAGIQSVAVLPLAWFFGAAQYGAMHSDAAGATFAIWTFGAAPANHPLINGLWQHWTHVIFDTPASNLLYINAVDQGAPVFTGGAIPDPNSTDNIYIGSSDVPGNFLATDNDHYLREIRVYARALQPREVMQRYQIGRKLNEPMRSAWTVAI